MNTPYLSAMRQLHHESDKQSECSCTLKRDRCNSYIALAEVDRLQARIKQAWEAADYGNEHGDSPRRTLDTVLRALGFPEPWG